MYKTSEKNCNGIKRKEYYEKVFALIILSMALGHAYCANGESSPVPTEPTTPPAVTEEQKPADVPAPEATPAPAPEASPETPKAEEQQPAA
jgi:hypothetical protein